MIFDQRCYVDSLLEKDKVTNDNVLRKMKRKRLHFRNNIARQKMAYAGHILRGSGVSVLCCCWKGNLKESKQEEGLELHGLMNCCNGHRKVSIMK